MPLYLGDCMSQLRWPISIIVAVIATSIPPYLTKWWYGSSFIEFHEKNAVSFWFGKGRLAVLTIALLYNIIRLIYECIHQDLFAILLTARVFGFIVQLLDHYWMQHHWIPYFVYAEKRGYLWIRFYMVIIGFLTYVLVYQIQMGILGYDQQIWFHQYVMTTLFYASLHVCFLFWFLWFILGHNNGITVVNRNNTSSKITIDVERLVRFRFHILRNSLASWIPFLLIIGLVGKFEGDEVSHEDFNDNMLQWRYPFMIAALLSVLIWVIHKFIAVPHELSIRQVFTIDDACPDPNVINVQSSTSLPTLEQQPPSVEIHLDRVDIVANGIVEKPSNSFPSPCAHTDSLSSPPPSINQIQSQSPPLHPDMRSQFSMSVVPFVESMSNRESELQSKPLLSISTKSVLSDDAPSQHGQELSSQPSFSGSFSSKSVLSDETLSFGFTSPRRRCDLYPMDTRSSIASRRQIDLLIDEVDVSNRSTVPGPPLLYAMAESMKEDPSLSARTPRRRALTIEDVHIHHQRNSLGSSGRVSGVYISVIAASVVAAAAINNNNDNNNINGDVNENNNDNSNGDGVNDHPNDIPPPPLNHLNSLSRMSSRAMKRVNSLAELLPYRMDLTHLLEIKKWEIFERTADKWVCIFYQIILWNVIVTVSQDMLAIYLDYGLHWVDYYCSTIVSNQALNNVQFLFDHLIA